jgi:hypothetical protein
VNLQEYRHLLAERVSLQRMLEEIPTEDVLDRYSLQSQLETVEQELSQVNPPKREPARARLTFRGRPVVGRYGIFAEFGAKATAAFSDVVAKIAAGLIGHLAPKGPIPSRDESQLLITGTAIGSFGFELEEAPADNQLDFGDDAIAGQALELTQNLLKGTVGSDEELADSAVATDPRAVAAIRSFLELLATNEAVCGLQVNDKLFQFKDVGEVRRGAARLSQDNLHEEPTQLTGEFQGVLPKARSFEFKLADGQEIVRGKVSPNITTPDEINSHLHQAITIDVLETRVGAGKPRYVLLKLPDEWNDADHQSEIGV